MQHFIELSAAVHELSWSQRNKKTAENSTVIATADSNNNGNNIPSTSFKRRHSNVTFWAHAEPGLEPQAQT